MENGSERVRLTPPVSDRDRALGSIDATVVLVEYGDYESAKCREAYCILRDIYQWLNNGFCLVFRHFPQIDLYPNSQRAAEVAEAAGAQGQFWQMHNYLFEHPFVLDNESLRQCAIALNLDVEQFMKEIEMGTHVRRVLEDFNSGLRSGVSQTPTFFINGIRYRRSFDLPRLIDAIQEAGADVETS